LKIVDLEKSAETQARKTENAGGRIDKNPMICSAPEDRPAGGGRKAKTKKPKTNCSLMVHGADHQRQRAAARRRWKIRKPNARKGSP